jgi:hypothetical protein
LTKAINSDQRRLRQLELAQKLNLDIINIVQTTMKIILQETQSEMEDLFPEQGTPVLAISLNDPITDLDERQIRAIEWVLITGSEELTLPCLKNGDVLFRRFLRTQHIQTRLTYSGRSPELCKSPCGTGSLLPSHPSRTIVRLRTQSRRRTGTKCLEYAQHSALWELFASFDRWEDYALKYMNTHTSRRDKLAEKQQKNEVRAALGEFIARAKTMVLSDEGLSAVLDETLRTEDPESVCCIGEN